LVGLPKITDSTEAEMSQGRLLGKLFRLPHTFSDAKLRARASSLVSGGATTVTDLNFKIRSCKKIWVRYE